MKRLFLLCLSILVLEEPFCAQAQSEPPQTGYPQSMPPQTGYPQGTPQQPLQGSAYQEGAPQRPLSGSASENSAMTPPVMPPLQAMPATYGQPKKPLVAAVDTHGTPVLPKWKSQPDEVIGHFGVQYFGIRMETDRPQSRRITFRQYMKWRGFKHSPCSIWLTPVADGSGGYFFHCMESPFGPRGWIYPIPKRGPEDKTVPWAVFFDQP